jgi:acetolactate synthase-1/2/3 large subunit
MTSTAEGVAAVLAELGVERIFGFPGGRVIEVFEALADTDVAVVRPGDEREASVMAEVHGRLTGKPGVLAGQGPWVGSIGAFGQMEARLGSSPMVVLTEASERGEYSTLAPYQQARGDYGGVDVPQILDAVTKEVWEPRTPAETLRTLGLAFKHATAGRPGPTALVLDGDAVTEDVPESPQPPLWEAAAQARTWTSRPTAADVAAAADALEAADRPVILAGNGVHAAGAHDELAAVADAYDAAVATSYLGKSAIPETHERAVGVVGSFGHEGANRVVSEADTLLVVGCRLNPMDANWLAPGFVRPDDQTILHADVDSRNAGWVYPADVGLVGDASESLAELAAAGSAENDWALDRAASAREDFHAPACEDDATPIKPQRAVQAIDDAVDADTLVTADSGNNRFWLLHYLQTESVQSYLGSGGVGGMGWSAPAAVAAALETEKDVVSVSGDGGFSMAASAVETAVEYGVAPVFVVLNDSGLGMVRQMDDGIPETSFRDTDFVGLAEAYGARGERVVDPGKLDGALADALAASEPVVLDVRIDPDEPMATTLRSSFYESVGGLHE